MVAKNQKRKLAQKKTTSKAISKSASAKQAIEQNLRHHAMFVGGLSLLLTLVFVALFVFTLVSAEDKARAAVACVAMLALYMLAMFTTLYIESTKIGKQQCKLCKHKFVPTFGAVFMALHIGTTRRLKCPKCGKRSWCKKVWE